MRYRVCIILEDFKEDQIGGLFDCKCAALNYILTLDPSKNYSALEVKE